MYSWEFNTKKQKNATWYTIFITVALGLIIWGFLNELVMMSIVIFMAVGVYILIENNSPDIMQIELNENGILVGDIFYDYSKIDNFSILYDRKKPIFLRLKINGKGFKILDIPLEGIQDIPEIRNFLSLYIQEDSNQELTTMDKIISYLKL